HCSGAPHGAPCNPRRTGSGSGSCRCSPFFRRWRDRLAARRWRRESPSAGGWRSQRRGNMRNGNGNGHRSNSGLASMVLDVANKGYRRLLVTSTGRGEGKSWVAAAAAQGLAEGDQERVLLVGRGQLHTR